MTTPRIDAAREAAEQLRAAGVFATVDPREAAANLPCVLFLPPTLRFTGLGSTHATEWRIAVLGDGPHGLDAWAQLDELLDQLAAHVAVVDADPGVYTLTGERTLPAYLCTVQD